MKKNILLGFLVYTIITLAAIGINLSEVASDEEQYPDPNSEPIVLEDMTLSV